jgi:tryptophan-rich sensory protein
MSTSTALPQPRRDGPPAPGTRAGRPRSGLALAAFIAVAQLAGLIGRPFTDTSAGSWYDRLDKPPFNPPGAVFGAVWTTLYVLMGVAAWLVWRQPPSAHRRRALGLFAVQLVLNAAWAPIFFGAHAPGWALGEIVVLLAAVVATVATFRRVEARAAALLLPYLGWVAFATVLNAAFVALN